MKQKKTATEIIADKFIKLLENGVTPWVKPWANWTSWSRLTGNDYNGANALLLSGGEYATFKQVMDSGGKIKKVLRVNRSYTTPNTLRT